MHKLLIVDDNYYDRKGLTELSEWNQLDFSEIYSAKDGEEGLAKALEFKPLLVLTDVSMPNLDGISMAKRILEKRPDTKFIFISCFDDSAWIRESIGLNSFGYILKPIEIEELIRVVKKVLKINDFEQSREQEVYRLRYQLLELQPFVQEQIIRDLIYSNMTAVGCERLKQFNMDLISFYTVSIIRLSGLNETFDLFDRAMVYYHAEQIKQYFFSDNNSNLVRIYSIIQNNGDIVVLLYLDNSTNLNDAERECFAYFNEFKDKIKREKNIDVSICIGGISNHIENAHELYNRAEHALNMNIYKNNSRVILADKTVSCNAFLDCDFDELKRELKLILENRDIKKCEMLVNKYYGNIEAVSKTVLKEFTLTVISIIQLLLFEMNLSMNDIFDDGVLIWEKLSRFNSIFDIKQWVYNILKSIIEHCNEHTGDRDIAIAKRIKKIIEEQYLNLENIDQISAQVYVSSVHANKIFKKCFGCTMFDYLTKVKIDKAKEMLTNPELKIYEIAEKLGYKSKTYFTSLFREFTGYTPKEYRIFKEKH